MNYYREREEAIMRGNIQLDDTTHKSSAFADFAHYWGVDDKVLLTRQPVLLNYDNDQQRRDSVTMEPLPAGHPRGDTLVLVTKKYEYLLEDEEGDVSLLSTDSET